MTDLSTAQAVIGVDYDEFKPETFRAFTVTLDGEEKRFRYFIQALRWAQENAESILFLTSFDNYEADLKRPTRH